jgi:hypothetical protein
MVIMGVVLFGTALSLVSLIERHQEDRFKSKRVG